MRAGGTGATLVNGEWEPAGRGLSLRRACWYAAAPTRQRSKNPMPTADACLSHMRMLMSTVRILQTLPMTVKEVAETEARQRKAK